MSSKPKIIPGPQGWPFIGNFFDLRDGDYPLQALERLAAKYGEIFQTSNGQTRRVVISSHEMLDAICDDEKFTKIRSQAPNPTAGKHIGLFSAASESEDWKVAHRVLMPAFGPLAIEELFDGMHDIARQLALKWAREGPENPILATDDFTRLTLDTIALCGMGYRFNSFYTKEQHPFVKAMTNNLTETQNRATRPRLATKLMDWTGQMDQVREDAKLQRRIGMEIVAKRRTEDDGNHKDILDRMIHGKDPVTGEGMPDGLIEANMITFLVAGHETTSSLISFAIYHLLKHPSAYNAAQAEIDAVIGDSPIQLAHLKKIPYVSAVLRETLRLFPTAPAFTRKLIHRESYSLNGYTIEPGDPVTVLLGLCHRDPKVYGNDAEEFKPERMLDEPFSKLPPNSWKPFGTGTRACIGRAFALQEATLVLAILLQRFDLRFDNPAYDLHLQVNLTMKPRDLYIRANLRKGVDATDLNEMMTTGPKAKSSSKVNAHISQVDENATPMKILFGSNTGTCEALAQRLAADAAGSGYAPKVEALDTGVRNLTPDTPVVLITASYEGQPPDNAKRFVEWVNNLSTDEVKGVRYAVFGCGHRDWTTTFHRIPKLVDSKLAEGSAERITEIGLTDVSESKVFDDFDEWKDEKFWRTLHPDREANGAGTSQTASDALDMEISADQRASSLRQDVVEAEVTKIEVLTAPDEPPKRHCEFRLPERLSYQCGDYLAVLPYNPPELVDRVMERFRLPKDATVQFKAGTPTTLPTGRWLSVRDLLSGYVELSQPTTQKDLRHFRSIATDGDEQKTLDDLIASRAADTKKSYTTAFDILTLCPNLPLPLSAFLSRLAPLRTRLYSISSSPAQNPTLATITYSSHPHPTKSYPVGVASAYLSTLRPGSRAPITIVPGKPAFRLPQPLATHLRTPALFICAGTGLAPFRGFVEERAALKQTQPDLDFAPAVLYIGCRAPDKDKLYGEELKQLAHQGQVELMYSYSRAPEQSEGHKYVQDVVKADRERVVKLWKEGAKVYICGSFALVEGVRAVLGQVLQDALEGQLGRKPEEEEVRAKMREWGSERLAADVFG